MSQTVILPQKCLGCDSPRVGVVDSRAVYSCGSEIRIVRGRIDVVRSIKCLEPEPKLSVIPKEEK